MNIEKELRDKGVEILRFTWVGLDGYIRSKGAYIDHVSELIKTGIGLTMAMMSFTPMDYISPYGSFGPQDEDVFLMPDITTFSVFPPSAMVICNLYRQGKPWEYDPRSTLIRTLDKIKEQFNFTFKSAFEIEFYLVKDKKPFDDARCFDPSAYYTNPIIPEIAKTIREIGIEPLRVIKEYGPGQYELDILHKEALRSADEVVIFKEVAKQISKKYGVEANFMPKPFNKLAGSGLHLNISAWKDNQNVFYNSNDKYGLSELAYSFIAGLLEHAKALTAIASPTINSYKRLVPGSWAPTKITYGYNNKSAMIRIPTPYPGSSHLDRRIEYRVPDPSTNPYLLLTAVIEAGIDGIERGLRPSEPINENAYYRKDVEDIPRNLREALNELKKDNRLIERIGRPIIEEFIKVKTAEVEEYESLVTDWEYEVYKHL
ncbi:glutamate--ammonia ligase [Sulfolobus sp. A20]|uniref:glutamine synthetase family protein n=1 Tax=Saccharolobus sp. A20 TaxID=1891280 RepID=UPI00084611B5|nr:glutamine synthetase family protein [Sulfolobus sp. A20]TRM78700.1 glutamine synthetase [Sulfolobus sp. A20-N-F8]TRM81799.1 glutamine synthetase [Sulfolobus sp. D5]TRM86615.1 glutamine synthetase [Sulfolobus sp. C3]TRN02608.1 glutamine synthetase [Sulfolobus sp. F1]AOL16907.1 glutamate--ammonia ligase [Sulfolobus sp. A20]